MILILEHIQKFNKYILKDEVYFIEYQTGQRYDVEKVNELLKKYQNNCFIKNKSKKFFYVIYT